MSKDGYPLSIRVSIFELPSIIPHGTSSMLILCIAESISSDNKIRLRQQFQIKQQQMNPPDPILNNTQQSPAIAATLKTVTQNKQTVSIRKVTIESITPVIAKVEEHIAYLIDETAALRKQNGNLLAAQANQKILTQQIITINGTLEKMAFEIAAFDKDKEGKLILHAKELVEVDEKINRLRSDALTQDLRIEQICNKNENYLELIDLNKQDQNQAVQTLKSSLENYYQQEMSKVTTISDEVETLQRRFTSQEEARAKGQLEIQKITNIATLYQTEREEIIKVIAKTSFLENNAVMTTEYEHYKKCTKIEMEFVKTSVRGMLDEALTPEIRKFLPKLISKLSDLDHFEATIGELCKGLERVKEEHRAKMDSMKAEWDQKFTKMSLEHSQSLTEMTDMVNQEDARLLTMIEENSSSVDDRLRFINSEITQAKETTQANLFASLSTLQTELKVYITNWGDSFIKEKQSQIYAIVQDQKPQQSVKEEKEMMELVISMQPLVQEAKHQIELSKQELVEAKQTINEKMGLFSNQITKLKSNITMETSDNKKALDAFSKKLKGNDQANRNLSQLVSTLVEATVLSYSLSVDQSYLQKNQEVYVTYNDGILFEVEEGELIKYRRKAFHPELLKRAVLTEFVKLIDDIILQQPSLGWTEPGFKPSHFFTSLQSTYVSMFEENLSNLPTIQESRADNSRQQDERVPKFGPTMLRKATPRKKMLSNQEVLSKTIDFHSNDQSSQSRYEKQDEISSPTRRNIRLKKLDRRQA